MICEKCFLYIVAVLQMTNGVKVNMQGSVGIGKDVMETIEYFINKNFLSGRRAMSASSSKHYEDQIMTIVTSTSLCKDYSFCNKNLPKYLNDYVTQLAKSIEGVFSGILNDNSKVANGKKDGDVPVFINELKHCLRVTKKVLKAANEKITADNEAYVWTEIVKKITAVFQNGAFKFLTERLEGKPKDILEINKKLTQKLVIQTIILERKFENQLCKSQNLCTKSEIFTTTLNTVLEQFKDIEEDKVKEFVKAFYEVLPDTHFFNILDDKTAKEFRHILNDMSYSDDVSAKGVLLKIQQIVADRLHSVQSDTRMPGGIDVELVHVILSDLDYIYSQGKEDVFNNFLTSYFEWIKEGSLLNASLRIVMRSIGHQIEQHSEKLSFKLANEVKVFLEITVDPDD